MRRTNVIKDERQRDISVPDLLSDLDFLQRQVEMMASRKAFSKKKDQDDILFESFEQDQDKTDR